MITELRLCVPADSSWRRDFKQEHIRAAEYLLHTINQRRIGWHADGLGFVNLKAEYLRRVMGRNALIPVREELKNVGAIDYRKHFVPGVSSMQYRLMEPFQPSRFVTCRDHGLLRRVRRVYTEEEGRLLPVHRWLKAKLATFILDVERARSIVSGMVPDMDSGIDVETYRALIGDQVTAFADELASGDVRLTCDEYGRVHTPLTNMPKSLRCCVASPEGLLTGIDLANSQPLFAGMVAREYATSSDKARSRLRQWKPPTKPYGKQSEACKDPGSQQTQQKPPSITMAEKSQLPLKTTTCDYRLRGTADLYEYLELCCRGRLYEELKPNDLERNDFKHFIFRDVFFGADQHPSALRETFAERFPTVARVLRELKGNDYRRLAWLMQHQESTLFIGRVCRRIKAERPSLPLATVHDSLVTTDEHIGFVTAIALDEFQKLGVIPLFKYEPYY